MLEIPNEYKNKIINRYGAKGEEWLENINNIVGKYKKQFQLQDIKLIENLSMNIVIFAKSHQYGEIVMKIGAPGKTSITEMKIMKYYLAEYVPQCYASCLEDRVMILERLTPGYSLLQLEDREERIKIFSNIANHLLVEVDDKAKDFPTFDELFKEKIEYVYQNKKKYLEIIEMVDIAYSIYQKIKKMNLKNYILHDDLHHKNILKTKDGWKAIDPHGIIGAKVIETSQFIREELELSGIEGKEMNEIVSLLSKHFKEDKKLILETLYINVVLKIIWYIKNRYSNETIFNNIEVAEKLLKYIGKRDLVNC